MSSNPISIPPDIINGSWSVTNMGSFAGLSRDHFVELISKIPFKDVLSIKKTCKAFYWLLTHNKDCIKQLMNKGNWQVFGLASPDLKQDKDLQEALLKNCSTQEKEVVSAAVNKDLRKDKELVLAKVKQNDFALNSAHEDLRKEKEVILATVKQDP